MAGLTPSQTKTLAIAFQCMESDPKINYIKFASLAGLKNEASARETLRQAKKKLLTLGTDDNEGNDGATAFPATGGEKKRKDAGVEEATPKKRVRNTPAKGTTSKKTTGAKGKGKNVKTEEDEDGATVEPGESGGVKESIFAAPATDVKQEENDGEIQQAGGGEGLLRLEDFEQADREWADELGQREMFE